MDKESFNRKCVSSAGLILCFMLAGCATVSDLDRIADSHRLTVDVKKSTEELLDKPFDRNKLIGKWEGEYSAQEFFWCHDGSYKKFPVNKWRMSYEFQTDGRCIASDYLNGKLIASKEGTWEYVINGQGFAELTLHGLPQPYWSVFWYNEDEIAFAYRNGNMAGEIHVKGMKRVYNETWTTDWAYNRDRYLNEKFITHHLKGMTGHRRELHVSPRILRRLTATSKNRDAISVAKSENSSDLSLNGNPNSATNRIYDIKLCERESGNDFAYCFVLDLIGNDKSLRTFRYVQKEFREAIKEDYAESFPGVDKNVLFVDFPEYKLKDGKIEGRAVVLTIAVSSLTYDPNTRKGILAVRVNANQYEEARKWVRKNIETLARDKNIALTTGEIPPAAKFYLGREELKDGNILEVEFRTE